MNEQAIVSKMHEYLHMATKELCAWLGKMLPRVGDDWWQVCVMDNLSFVQRKYAGENGYSKLEDLDLAALLRVADKSWYDMRSFAYLPTRDRQCVRDMAKVRNHWAHISGAIAEKDIVLRDLDTILSFFENVIVTNKYTQGITDFKQGVCQRRFKIERKRRRNFVVFRRWGCNRIKRFLAEKGYSQFAVFGA